MTLSEKIAALESRTGINRPVKQLRSLMQQHIPETLKIPAIQVAGTNGKGSTVTWMSLLADRPVIGTFTSPHMFSHFERMTINNQPIPADQWEAIYDRWLPLFEEQDFTMFEADLWMAMAWFAENRVDLALMEVGMGGGRDATTALDYLATGITNIGRDHMQYLGSTLEEVAKAKAGIFKPGIPALTAEQDPALFEILSREAAQAGTLLTKVPALSLPKDFPKYQEANLGLAAGLLTAANIPMKPLEQAEKNFFWPGRMQVVSQDPLQVVDGAHNPEGIEALCRSLPGVDRIFFSVLADKQAPEMIRRLLETGKAVTLVRFDTRRLADLEELSEQFGLDLVSLEEALSSDKPALYCGSLKFAAAVLKGKHYDKHEF